MARLGHRLSTLRSAAHTAPRKTRFRLRAKLYRVGLATHRAPTKGFQGVVVTSFPPLPSLLGARSGTVSMHRNGPRPLPSAPPQCQASADYFCTCDDRLLKRARAVHAGPPRVLTPVELIGEIG